MDTCAPVFAEQIELQEHNGLRDSSILINASGSHPCRNAMLESKLTSQPHHRTNEWPDSPQILNSRVSRYRDSWTPSPKFHWNMASFEADDGMVAINGSLLLVLELDISMGLA